MASSHTDSQQSAVSPPRLQPVDLNEIRLEHAQAHEKTLTAQPQLEADPSGMLQIKISPSCSSTLFMLPTFFFVGCCLSSSKRILFNDTQQTVTITSNPGLCCVPPFVSTKVVAYGDIANVVLVRNPYIRTNGHATFDIKLLLRNEQQVTLTAESDVLCTAMQADALAYHRFLFGRADPATYQAPSSHSLEL
jgi:hypothetical protein